MKTQPEAAVEHIVAEVYGSLAPGHRAEIGPSTTLAELGLDSLGQVELAVALEERLGARIADSDPASLRTVADVAAAVRNHLRTRPRLPRGIGMYQQVSKRIGGPVVRAYCRLQVSGAEHVPLTGPAIVAANHRSMWDVPLTVVATPRPLLFMAKRELFGDPFRRWLWWALGGFPVDRKINDISAVDASLAVLDRGGVLGLYPEGTRSFDRPMLPFLRGAAWIALRTGVPIVPCGIRGSEARAPDKPLIGKRVRVAFGPPIPVEAIADPGQRLSRSAELTARLRDAVAGLLS